MPMKMMNAQNSSLRPGLLATPMRRVPAEQYVEGGCEEGVWWGTRERGEARARQVRVFSREMNVGGGVT